MRSLEEQLTVRCSSALRDHLAGAGESSLHAAYELGRDALACGFGILDMAAVIHEATARLVSSSGQAGGRDMITRAETFVIECFSPFEMAYRGAREASAALRRMDDVREEDIRRLARELHDEAGQMLVAAHLSLRDVANDLGPAAAVALERVHDQLRKAEGELRRIAHEMRPSMLDDLGLIPALAFLAKGFSARHGINARVEGGIDRLLPETETALYRITQEALNNAARHAKAREVVVSLIQTPDRLRLSIVDDGCGFESGRSRGGGGGLGLRGIRERLKPLDGTLEVRSAPDHGTELAIEVPLSEGIHAARSSG